MRDGAGKTDHQAVDSATLLEQLHGLLRQGGVRSLAQAARDLGTSPALVEAMLDDLSRRGYLQAAEEHCAPAACAGCAQGCHSVVAGAGRVWRVRQDGF